MKKRMKGFTLVELLIVMALVAMLSLLGGASYITAQKRGRNARREADIQQIRSALEMYRTDMGGYPVAATGCDSSIGTHGTDCTLATGTDWDTTSSMADALNDTPHMTLFPKDPYNNTTYYYQYESFNTDGTVCATFPCPRYTLTYQPEPLTGAALPAVEPRYNP